MEETKITIDIDPDDVCPECDWEMSGFPGHGPDCKYASESDDIYWEQH